MQLWIVGLWINENSWAFGGVFDDKEKADKACKTKKHFYAPAILNEQLSKGTEIWPGCVYPRAEKE